MKKLTYYVAAFALCCGVSQTLTSCVDETEEPDYVKAVREAEMKAEIAKNEKNAKEDGKQSEAAFTQALLDNTISNTDAYKNYVAAKNAWEYANGELATATSNLELFFSSINDKAVQLVTLEQDIEAKKDAKKALSSPSDIELAQADANIVEAESRYNAYKANIFVLDYNISSLDKVPVRAYTADPGSWEKTYGNYLACVKVENDAKAKLDDLKKIYDDAITAMQKANN